MAEIKLNYWYAALSIFITALVVGTATYQLKPTGSYKVCDNGAGWQFNSGDGSYYCGDRKYDCSDVRNTKGGKPNYFCDEAVRVEIEKVAVQSGCPAPIERVCPDFISYTDGGKTFCRRYSDGTEKCTEEYPY